MKLAGKASLRQDGTSEENRERRKINGRGECTGSSMGGMQRKDRHYRRVHHQELTQLPTKARPM